MARIITPLTDLECRRAKLSDGKSRLFDGGGLYLQLNKSGSKIWHLRFTQLSKKESTISLGPYPAISLSAARTLREEMRTQLAQGKDPVVERELAKQQALQSQGETFELLATEWLELKRPTWSAGYYQRIENALKANAYPDLGKIPLRSITGLQILKSAQKIERRGAYEMASRVLDSISQVVRYAVSTGRATADVSYGLNRLLQPRPPVQHFPHIQHDALPGLVKRVKAYTGRPETIYAIKLMMHTFPRTNELRWAEWSEFDLEGRLWTIPAERMKGRLNRKQAGADHLVPLSRQVLKLLDNLHKITGRHRFLFPGMRNPSTTPISAETINKALKIMGYEGQQTGHGFRSLASTMLNESGKFRREAIDAQLAHVNRNKVEAAYNRAIYLEERKEILQWWSDYLEKLGTS